MFYSHTGIIFFVLSFFCSLVRTFLCACVFSSFSLFPSGVHQLHQVDDGTHAGRRGGARGNRLRPGVEAWGNTAYQELGKPSSGGRLRPELLPGREGRSDFRSVLASWLIGWAASWLGCELVSLLVRWLVG